MSKGTVPIILAAVTLLAATAVAEKPPKYVGSDPESAVRSRILIERWNAIHPGKLIPFPGTKQIEPGFKGWKATEFHAVEQGLQVHSKPTFTAEVRFILVPGHMDAVTDEAAPHAKLIIPGTSLYRENQFVYKLSMKGKIWVVDLIQSYPPVGRGYCPNLR